MEKGEFGKKVEKKEEETPEELGKKFLEEKREELKKETSKWGFSIPQSLFYLLSGLSTSGVGLELSRVAFLRPEQIAQSFGKELSELPPDILNSARILAVLITIMGIPLIIAGIEGLKENIKERKREKSKPESEAK
jgi:hypothetical protein